MKNAIMKKRRGRLAAMGLVASAMAFASVAGLATAAHAGGAGGLLVTPTVQAQDAAGQVANVTFSERMTVVSPCNGTLTGLRPLGSFESCELPTRASLAAKLNVSETQISDAYLAGQVASTQRWNAAVAASDQQASRNLAAGVPLTPSNGVYSVLLDEDGVASLNPGGTTPVSVTAGGVTVGVNMVGYGVFTATDGATVTPTSTGILIKLPS